MNLNTALDLCRVCFSNNYQRELIVLAREKALERSPHKPWREVVATIIARSPRMVYHYRSGGSALTVKQVKSLADFVSLPMEEIDKHITKIRKEYEWCSDGGKTCFRKHGKSHYLKMGRRGGKIVGNMLVRKYGSEYFREKGKLGGKLGYRTIVEKYGANQMREWARKAAPLGGTKSAEKQNPTKQQERLINHNIELGLLQGIDFKINHTIKFDEDAYNFDFVYFRDSMPIAVEEVTEVVPSQAGVRSRVLDVIERKKWLEKHGSNVAVLFTMRKSKNVGREFKFPADAILVLLDEGIIPLFDTSLQKRASTIKDVYVDKFPDSYSSALRKWAVNDIEANQKFLKRRAKGEKSKSMNQSELFVHKKLSELGLLPHGKVILRSIHGTFMIPDNHFTIDREKWHVFVSSASRSTLKTHITHHAGHAFMMKRIFVSFGKCMTVILGKDEPIDRLTNNKWSRYLLKYSDLIITDRELAKIGEYLNFSKFLGSGA